MKERHMAIGVPAKPESGARCGFRLGCGMQPEETEVELKFQIPPKRRAALSAELRRGRISTTSLRAHYFDTADGLLAEHSIALRLRREGPRWVQTLKASAGHSAVRLEHNADVADGGTTTVVPPLDLDRHRGSPAHRRLAEALERAAGAGRCTLLREVYRTDVRRDARLLHGDGGLIVEAALDEGRVIAGTAVHRLCEIEFELEAGPPAGLFELAGRWAGRHRLWLDTVSKAERGHLLALGQAHAAAIRARPPDVDSKDGPRSFARACVQACMAQILPNASAIAAGSDDAEQVHQLRVGLRRLRTVIGEMAEFDSGIDPGWDGPLAALFDALGAVRDRHLLDTGIASALRAAGAPPWPRQMAEAAGGLAPHLHDSELQQVLLAALAFAMQASPAAGPAFDGSAQRALRERLDALRRSLRRDARRFADLPIEAQHRVRKRLKRLRYLAEFLGPLFSARKVAAYLECLEPAQDALGRHNDEAVALAHFREQAAAAAGRDADDRAGAWFAVGWLCARQPHSAAAAASALRAACKARPFWHGKTTGH
jgi:inorganic triphosphatase YgiF